MKHVIVELPATTEGQLIPTCRGGNNQANTHHRSLNIVHKKPLCQNNTFQIGTLYVQCAFMIMIPNLQRPYSKKTLQGTTRYIQMHHFEVFGGTLQGTGTTL